MSRRIDLKTGFLCNNSCRFCVQAHKKQYGNKATSQLKKSLDEAAGKYAGVVFTGGEPTIRSDIFELVAYARARGYTLVQIQSNGRMFGYKDFCRRLIEAGANEFALAIHGHIPALHDYLTSAKGSFSQTLGGITNLLAFGQSVITNTVVTKSNYRHLPQIAQLLVDSGVKQFQFAFVHMMGNALKNSDSVVPRKSLVEPYLKKALSIGISRGARVMAEAVPYCFMGGVEGCVAEEHMPDTKVYDLDYIIEDFSIVRQREGKAKRALCKKCLYYRKCEGPWKEYPEKFGWDEFAPVVSEKQKSKSRVAEFTRYCFNLFTAHNGDSRICERAKQLWEALFSGFDETVLAQNQKFDFSFSGPSRDTLALLRFSYNNFGEKEGFDEKILKSFAVFIKDKSLLVTIRSLLERINNIGNRHQTTFGIEWPYSSSRPRLKLYFEELFHYYKKNTIVRMAETACRILDISPVALRIDRRHTIGAICIDIAADKTFNIKIYYLYKKISRVVDKQFSGFPKTALFQRFIRSFAGKGSAFYYVTDRHDNKGALLSRKLYKIYEIQDGSSLQAYDDGEIAAFLEDAHLASLRNAVGKFLAACKKYELRSIPVIAAVDVSHRREKAEVYFTVK